MKIKEQIQNELDCGTVLTVDEFDDAISGGTITRNDGYGYFHDGENETDFSVFSPYTRYEDIKDMPYIIWYNK